MVTRSRIGMVKDDGTVESIYCHWDGYPSHNGKILKEHYADKSKVEKLLQLGDISKLGEYLEKSPNNDPKLGVVVAYARDRDEDLNPPRMNKSIDAFVHSNVEEYGYLFNEGKWFVVYGYGDHKMEELTDDIISND